MKCKLAMTLASGLALSAGGLGFDGDDDASEEAACPCGAGVWFINTRPGDTFGSGSGRTIRTTATTWIGSDTVKKTTQHEHKTSVALGGADLLGFSDAHAGTLTTETGATRENEQPQVSMEYSDFTVLAGGGACYSYNEQPKCSDETYTQCAFDIDFKVTFHNGNGNRTFIDIGVATNPALTNRGPPPQPPLVRLTKPGQTMPVLLSKELDCGSHSRVYVTSYEAHTYSKPTLGPGFVRYDFGYKVACGQCPEEPSDG